MKNISCELIMNLYLNVICKFSVKAFKRSLIRDERNIALRTSIPLKVLCFCLFICLFVSFFACRYITFIV